MPHPVSAPATSQTSATAFQHISETAHERARRARAEGQHPGGIQPSAWRRPPMLSTPEEIRLRAAVPTGGVGREPGRGAVSGVPLRHRLGVGRGPALRAQRRIVARAAVRRQRLVRSVFALLGWSVPSRPPEPGPQRSLTTVDPAVARRGPLAGAGLSGGRRLPGLGPGTPNAPRLRRWKPRCARRRCGPVSKDRQGQRPRPVGVQLCSKPPLSCWSTSVRAARPFHRGLSGPKPSGNLHPSRPVDPRASRPGGGCGERFHARQCGGLRRRRPHPGAELAHRRHCLTLGGIVAIVWPESGSGRSDRENRLE